MFVQPHIVIARQKQRFRRYWRRLSQRSQPGRPALAQEVRDLIRDMSRSNPTWRAPQIVEEGIEHTGDGGKVPRALTETTIAHVERPS